MPPSNDVRPLLTDSTPRRLKKTLDGVPRGREVEITVDFNGLKAACDVLLDEGWRLLRIDLMKDRPGCSISAVKNGAAG